jgi:hypothetical protein
MDDIVVWCDNVEDHTRHLTLIMDALSKDELSHWCSTQFWNYMGNSPPCCI